jgi:ribA/ribD-fused uncharacterized protein
MKPEDYGYVVKNNLCLFQKGPLSNWWGGFKGQDGGFELPIPFRTYSLDVLQWEQENAIEDYRWNCVEQYMMAAKACLHDDFKTFQKIIATGHPAEQKKLGREVKNFDPEVWEEFRYGKILQAIAAKFDQNFDLQHFLISNFHPLTIFAEASPWDKIWGIGLGPEDPKALDINTWEGENLLGQMIGEVCKSYLPQYQVQAAWL